MTREELKAHCEKQIEMCEFWAISKGEKPSGKVYEEHKLILKLLEQEPRKGHWIKTSLTEVSGGDFKRGFKCSHCNYVIVTNDFNFCPNCGADMRGEQV